MPGADRRDESPRHGDADSDRRRAAAPQGHLRDRPVCVEPGDLGGDGHQWRSGHRRGRRKDDRMRCPRCGDQHRFARAGKARPFPWRARCVGVFGTSAGHLPREGSSSPGSDHGHGNELRRDSADAGVCPREGCLLLQSVFSRPNRPRPADERSVIGTDGNHAREPGGLASSVPSDAGALQVCAAIQADRLSERIGRPGERRLHGGHPVLSDYASRRRDAVSLYDRRRRQRARAELWRGLADVVGAAGAS